MDQVVHEESKDLYWLEATIPPEKQSKYVNENRILMCSDPKSGTLGKFSVGSLTSGDLISEEKQVVNISYMKSKCLQKDGDIDLKSTYKTKNAIDPTDDYDYVTNHVCKSRSGKDDNNPGITGIIGGIIGGAISGALSSLSL